MDDYNLIDALLDSYGVLEVAHERFCSSTDPGKLDRAKFDVLQAAIAEYQRAVEAYMSAAMMIPGAGGRSASAVNGKLGIARSNGNVLYLSR